MSVALIRADTLYAWRGPSLLVTTLRGECGDAHPLSGFYYREARVLRTFRIEINGERPWLAEAALTAPERIDFTYVHPEITQPGGGGTGQSGDEEGRDGWEAADGTTEQQALTARVVLEPQQAREFRVSVTASLGAGNPADPSAEERLNEWRSRFTRVEIPGNREFERVLTRNVPTSRNGSTATGGCWTSSSLLSVSIPTSS